MIDIKVKKELLAPDDSFQLDIDIQIDKGSFVAFYGDSGAGKSSFLRILAGLIKPDSGSIRVGNEYWFDSAKKINIPPQQRKIGFVFQEDALFPNMTVIENIAFALPKREDQQWLEEILSIINLKDLENRAIHTLSGGQKQRVSIARAIARKPAILLLDEALSALDHGMRSELQDYILSLHEKLQLSSIMVSHDLGEISKMADLVFVIENGKITRSGDVLSIFSNRNVSGKFQFNGSILAIKPADVIFIVTILIGKNIVKVVVDKRTAANLKIGDSVLVVSKAFNPIIYKIEK
jgi:molybdate transport system ATP-binding protein